jgi:hypothetical protein
MHAVTVGLTNFGDLSGSQLPPPQMTMDPAQLQQLMQLLGAKQPGMPGGPQVFVPPSPAAAAAAASAPKQTAVVECPKSMVGRVIGKGGETIKALQQYTGAMIQIDQSTDPTRVTIAGSPQSLQLAVSMVSDIVRGTFKGFAMLRQIAMASGLGPFAQPQPVYVQGYGFVPPSQVFSPEEAAAAAGGAGVLRSPPTGPLTPPITPLRAGGGAPGMGGLPPEAFAALLGAGAGMPQQQQPVSAGMSQEALIAQLLGQLAVGGGVQAPPPMEQHRMGQATTGMDQGAIQMLLAQAGLMGAGQAATAAGAGAQPGVAQLLPSSTAPTLPASTALMLSAQGTPAVLGTDGQSAFRLGSPGTGSAPHSTGSASPTHSLSGAPSLGATLGSSPVGGYTGLTSAALPQLAGRPTSGESSPLGRFGAIGSGMGNESARSASPVLFPPGANNPWDAPL